MARPAALLRLASTALALALALTGQNARAIDRAMFGNTATCRQGDCENGSGTILASHGIEYTGTWANGRFIDGNAYALRSPIAPDRVETLIMDANGRPKEGTLLRGNRIRGLVGEFTGTFANYENPFFGQPVSGFARGAYVDHAGNFIYEGEFSYVPISFHNQIAGYFVLSGVRIDTALDEVTRGLFISDMTLPGEAIMFHAAEAEYLEKIHTEFAAQKLAAETAAAGRPQIAARAAERPAPGAEAQPARRRGGGLFGKLLGVVSGLSSIGGMNLGPLKANALQGLTGSLGGGSPEGALKSILSAVSRSVIKDPKLAQILGSATDPEKLAATLTGMATGSGPVSRSEYAAERAAELQGEDRGRSGSDQTIRAVMTIIKGKGSTSSITQALGGVLKDSLAPRPRKDQVAAMPATAEAPTPTRPGTPTSPAPAAPALATTASTPVSAAKPAAPAAPPKPATTAATAATARPANPAALPFGCARLEGDAALRKAMVTAAAEKAQLAMFVSPAFHAAATSAPFLGCRTVARDNVAGGKSGEPMLIPGHPMNSHGFIYDAYRGTLGGNGTVLSAMTVRADLVDGDAARINTYPKEDGAEASGVIGGTAQGYWIYLYR